MPVYMAIIGLGTLAYGIYESTKTDQENKELKDESLDLANKKMGIETGQFNQQIGLSKEGLALQNKQLNMQNKNATLDRAERAKQNAYLIGKDSTDRALGMLNQNAGLRAQWLDMWKSSGKFSASTGGV